MKRSISIVNKHVVDAEDLDLERGELALVTSENTIYCKNLDGEYVPVLGGKVTSALDLDGREMANKKINRSKVEILSVIDPYDNVTEKIQFCVYDVVLGSDVVNVLDYNAAQLSYSLTNSNSLPIPLLRTKEQSFEEVYSNLKLDIEIINTLENMDRDKDLYNLMNRAPFNYVRLAESTYDTLLRIETNKPVRTVPLRIFTLFPSVAVLNARRTTEDFFKESISLADFTDKYTTLEANVYNGEGYLEKQVIELVVSSSPKGYVAIGNDGEHFTPKHVVTVISQNVSRGLN